MLFLPKCLRNKTLSTPHSLWRSEASRWLSLEAPLANGGESSPSWALSSATSSTPCSSSARPQPSSRKACQPGLALVLHSLHAARLKLGGTPLSACQRWMNWMAAAHSLTRHKGWHISRSFSPESTLNMNYSLNTSLNIEVFTLNELRLRRKKIE